MVGLPLVADMKRLRGIARIGIDHINALIVIGNLVHELQRERGLSSAHVSAPGQDSGPLVEQRRRAGQFLTQWHNTAENLTLMGKAAVAREGVRKQLSILAKVRVDILDGKTDFATVVATYSQIIAALLDMSVAIVHATARGPTSRAALAYCNLLWAKEAAGRERATLTAALKTPPLAPATRARCLDLVMTQDMYLRQFELLAGSDMIAMLKNALSAVDGPVIALRAQAMAENGDAVAPRDWFAQSTRRIDALKGIEDHLAAAMKTGAADFITATQFQTWMARSLVGISAAAMTVMIVLTRVLF